MQSLFTKLKKEHDVYAKERGVIINTSRGVLKLSKQAIFAAHRGDAKGSKRTLAKAEEFLTTLQKSFAKDAKLAYEGSYLAALEEYVEAKTFVDYLNTGKITHVTIVNVPYEAYVSGLADVTGELLRQMVLQTTAGDIKNLQAYYNTAAGIVGGFLEFDLSGKMRHKFDEAKRNLKSMEQILYDVSLRR